MCYTLDVRKIRIIKKTMKRTRHPSKEIEEAIKYAESKGWRYKKSGNSAHAWGRLLCPLQAREGDQISIWSTPRSEFNHAQQIRRAVDKCTHGKVEKNI